MGWFFAGAAAFVLFVLYDINSVVWKKKYLQSFFSLGVLLLFASTGVCLLRE